MEQIITYSNTDDVSSSVFQQHGCPKQHHIPFNWVFSLKLYIYLKLYILNRIINDSRDKESQSLDVKYWLCEGNIFKLR